MTIFKGVTSIGCPILNTPSSPEQAMSTQCAIFIEACKEEGAIVRLYYKSGTVSDELLNVCDERYEIDQAMIDKCLETSTTSSA